MARGVHEDLTIQNHSDRPQTVSIEVEYGSDFADLFEVKDRIPKRGQLHSDLGASQVTMTYTRDAYRRDTVIEFSENFSVGLERARCSGATA